MLSLYLAGGVITNVINFCNIFSLKPNTYVWRAQPSDTQSYAVNRHTTCLTSYMLQLENEIA